MLYIILFLLYNYYTVFILCDKPVAEFPYFAQIITPFEIKLPGRRKSTRYSSCGATLIHPRWLLTAAHCFPNSTYEIQQIERSLANEVFVGFYSNGVYEKNSIIKVYRDPHFQWIKQGSTQRIRHDIAVVKLRSQFKTNKYIQTINLPPKNKKIKNRVFKDCKNGMVLGTERSTTQYQNPSSQVSFLKANPKKKEQLSESVVQTGTLFFSEIPLNQRYYVKGTGGPFVCNVSGRTFQYGVLSRQMYGKKKIIFVYENIENYSELISRYTSPVQKKHNNSGRRGYVLVNKSHSRVTLMWINFVLFVLNIIHYF